MSSVFKQPIKEKSAIVKDFPTKKLLIPFSYNFFPNTLKTLGSVYSINFFCMTKIVF